MNLSPRSASTSPEDTSADVFLVSSNWTITSAKVCVFSLQSLGLWSVSVIYMFIACLSHNHAVSFNEVHVGL